MTKYTAEDRIKATNSTATGIITHAGKSLIKWRWDHDTTQEWDALPAEFADIATVTETKKTALVAHLNALYGKIAAGV